jgi:hypothetical protein
MRTKGSCLGAENKKDEAPEELRPSKMRFVETLDLVPTVATIAIATAATTVPATATAATAAAEATTAAAAAEATTAAATAEAATRAIFLRTRFIDRQLTAAEIDAVHLFCSLLGFICRAHGDERETAGAAGHLVHGDVNIGHGTELPKC